MTNDRITIRWTKYESRWANGFAQLVEQSGRSSSEVARDLLKRAMKQEDSQSELAPIRDQLAQVQSDLQEVRELLTTSAKARSETSRELESLRADVVAVTDSIHASADRMLRSASFTSDDRELLRAVADCSTKLLTTQERIKLLVYRTLFYAKSLLNRKAAIGESTLLEPVECLTASVESQKALLKEIVAFLQENAASMRDDRVVKEVKRTRENLINSVAKLLADVGGVEKADIDRWVKTHLL